MVIIAAIFACVVEVPWLKIPSGGGWFFEPKIHGSNGDFEPSVQHGVVKAFLFQEKVDVKGTKKRPAVQKMKPLRTSRNKKET